MTSVVMLGACTGMLVLEDAYDILALSLRNVRGAQETAPHSVGLSLCLLLPLHGLLPLVELLLPDHGLLVPQGMPHILQNLHGFKAGLVQGLADTLSWPASDSQVTASFLPMLTILGCMRALTIQQSYS